LMRRDLERRLARVEITAPAISWGDRQAAHHRQSLRARVELHELIRERLRIMGIDPAIAVALRRCEEAGAELAAIPDTIELRAADEAIARSERSDGTERAHQVREKIERMAEQYRDCEHPPDLASASPAQLLAFCVAVEIEAWG
jgi:hypothetical protein